MLLLVFMYFFYPEKYIWGIEEYRIVFYLNIILFLAVIYRYKGLTIFGDHYSRLIFLLAGSFFLSAMFSKVNSNLAIDSALLFFKAVVFWVVLKNILARDIHSVDLFLWICMGSLSLLALWGIEQYFLGNQRLEAFGGPQVSGSNQIASAFIWGLPIAYFKMLSESGRKRLLCLACLILLLIGVIYTESRQAFLALVFYTGVIFITVKGRRKGLVLGLMLMLGVAVLPLIPDEYWERMETISAYKSDASSSGRLETWAIALDVFYDYPLLGVGADNFYLIAHRYARIGQHIRVTHNTFMQILSEEGVVGISLFVSLIAYTLISLWKIGRRSSESSPSDPISYYAMAMFMSLAGVLICSMFQNKADHEFLYWPAAVAAALQSIRMRIPEETINQSGYAPLLNEVGALEGRG